MLANSPLIEKIYSARKEATAFNYYQEGWKSVAYRDFFKTAESLATYLPESAGIGLKKGDRVSIFSENRYEWCAAYLAILLAGGITVPIDAHLSPEEIRNILIDSETKVVFVSKETRPRAEEAVKGLTVKLIDFDTLPNITLPQPLPSREGDCRGGACSALEGVNVAPDDLASLVYTSGTTGNPKAVILTHGNLASDIDAVMGAGLITGEDNILSILPLHHTYSLMCTFLVPLSMGAGVTYPASLKGPDLISAMKETGVTILISVPRIVESLRDSLMGKLKGLPFPLSSVFRWAMRLSAYLRRNLNINLGKAIFFFIHRAFGGKLRYIASGGARLDPEVMAAMEALGFTVIEGYGLTETSPVVTFTPPDRRKPGSVGRPLSSVEIKIEAGGPAPGEGEIAIKGPMVMKGYYKNPELTAEAIKDGWFLSGDLGYMDSDGYLYITGRAKDVIVLSSGKNIYPEDVEREYAKIPLIKEICVLGRGERPGLSERLEAVIVPDTEYLKREKIGNINEALRWEVNSVSRRLPAHMRLMGYTLYAEPLPKTPLGKFRRFMIKDLTAHKPPALKEDKTLTEDETGRRVRECLKPLLEESREVQSGDNLDLDLGLDSLKRIELVAALEREFSVKLPEGFASEVQTVRELVSRIEGIRGIYKGERLPLVREEGTASLSVGGTASCPPLEKGAGGGFYEIEKSPLASWPVRLIFRSLIRSFLRVFYGFEVKGLENLPGGGPFIIAPNHSSYIDGFVVAAALPQKVYKRVYFQGFQRYFRGALTSLFARLGHVILIDPETFLGRALELSGEVIRRGDCLVIFPEGGRSFDGSLMPFKKGIGMLSLGLNVPVVPLYISGTYEMLPRDARWLRAKKALRHGRLKLVFGRPLLPGGLEPLPGEMDFSKKPVGLDDYQHFANVLRERVQALGNGI